VSGLDQGSSEEFVKPEDIRKGCGPIPVGSSSRRITSSPSAAKSLSRKPYLQRSLKILKLDDSNDPEDASELTKTSIQDFLYFFSAIF